MAAGDNPEDLAALASYGAALADGVERALPGWVADRIVERAAAWDPAVAAGLGPQAEAAGVAATLDVVPALRLLLSTDVDEQRAGPLEVLRRAVPHATAVLVGVGVPEVARDEVRQRLFPDDRYDLSPASFVELGPEVAEAGIAWGAAKAHVVLARRRAEGRR